MSNNKFDHLIKHDRHTRRIKCRLKSSIVRDPNGSISTFRQFYQSGGRDYEEYRLWLQTLSKSEQLSTSPIDLNKIKKEPIDIESNIVTVFPSSPPPPQQPSQVPKMIYTHLLLKPVRPLPISTKSQHSLPLTIFSPSQLTTTSLKPQTRLPYDHSHLPIVPISCSSPLINWSVTDVGRFIEEHFPEKNIARKFVQQKIDGRTLPLLTEDHLTRIFKMKLGPALYLLALISNIKN